MLFRSAAQAGVSYLSHTLAGWPSLLRVPYLLCPRGQSNYVNAWGRVGQLSRPGPARGGGHIPAQGVAYCLAVMRGSRDPLTVCDHPSSPSGGCYGSYSFPPLRPPPPQTLVSGAESLCLSVRGLVRVIVKSYAMLCYAMTSLD